MIAALEVASPFLVAIVVLFIAIGIQHVVVDQRAKNIVALVDRVLVANSTEAKKIEQVDAALDAKDIALKISYDIDRIQAVSAIATTFPGVILITPTGHITELTIFVIYAILIVFVLVGSPRFPSLRRQTKIPHVTVLTLLIIALLLVSAIAAFCLNFFDH